MIIEGCDLWGRRLSYVEWIIPNSNNDECDPIRLPQTNAVKPQHSHPGPIRPDHTDGVGAHASVLLPDGNIVTCGGETYYGNEVSKCQILTSTGDTRSFPSMIYKRSKFGMSTIKGAIYVIGGYPSINKMESINITTGNQWKKEPNMPFEGYGHCVVTIKEKIVVIGGRKNVKIHVSKNNSF